MDPRDYAGAGDLTPYHIDMLRRTAAQELANRSLAAVLGYLMAVLIYLFTTNIANEHPILILSCLSSISIAIAIRMFIRKRFISIYESHPQLWLTLFGSSALLMGSTWGILSALTLYYYDSAWPMLIAGILTPGVASGGLVSLAMHQRLMRSFFLLTMLPTILTGFWLDNHHSVSLALVFSGGLIYLMAQSGNVSRSYWHAQISSVQLDLRTRLLLNDLTFHDPLTSLPNRILFIDRLDQTIRDAKHTEMMAGIMVLGLDRFISVNDTLGHQAGDQLLRDVAERLTAAVRDHDTVSRLNGDVFGLIFTNIEQVRDITLIANKLRAALAKPFNVAGMELFINASIGITVTPHDSDNAEQLIKNAEAAMYRAKEQSGNMYQFYKTQLASEAINRLQFEMQLRRALERNEFTLHYQPKLSLKTKRISGMETLIRWQPSDGNLVSPLKFIPILEDLGLIVPVGEWVLRTACLQFKQWLDAGLNPGRLAINLSARQFRDHDLVSTVRNALNEAKLAPTWLELEITESMLLENTDQTSKVLHELHAMGVHLAIDDFGTGYSSLSYLKRMPIQTLKIDRSFVKDITIDNNDAAVVQAVIAMAHNLNLTVVAEGVETVEQLTFLQDQSCDEIQGYYFSKPLTVTDTSALLERLQPPSLASTPLTAINRNTA